MSHKLVTKHNILKGNEGILICKYIIWYKYSGFEDRDK